MNATQASLLPQDAYEDRSLLTYTTVSVWGATLAIAAGCAFTGQLFLGVALLGTVAIFHSFLDPRVPLFILVAIIPLESLISVIPQVATLGKFIGVWVLVWSIPRISRAVTGGGWDKLAKWVLLLLVWAGIACAWSLNKPFALVKVTSMAMVWSLLLLVCVQVRTARIWRELLIVFACSCLLLSLVTWQQGGVASLEKDPAARWTQESVIALTEDAAVADVNAPARMVGVGLLTCVYLFFSSKRKIMKLFTLVAMVFMAGAIIVYQGRAVYLAVPVALVGSMVLTKAGSGAQRILLGIGLALIGSVLAYFMGSMGLLGEGIQERFVSIFEEGWGTGNRDVMWAAHFNAFVSTGFRGMGTVSMRWTAESLYHVAHNDILSIMGNLGIVGLIAYVGVHTCFFLRIRRMGVFWPQFFCYSAWIFVVWAGLTEDDYTKKVCALPLALVLAGIRVWGVNESRSRRSSLPNRASQGYRTSYSYAR
jgi:O-antigen ligase